MTSSDRDDTNGITMMPITRPAASALVGWADRSGSLASPVEISVVLIHMAIERIAGATTSKAKKPYTTVGMPARISRIGLTQLRTFGPAYSDK